MSAARVAVCAVATALAFGAAACSAHDRRGHTGPTGRAAGDRAELAAPGPRLPDGITPLRYELRLEIDPTSETFRGAVNIKVRIDKPTDHVWLHVDDLEIATARFDDGPLVMSAVQGDQMRAFAFGRIVEPRELTLALTFVGHTSRDEQGLFRQRGSDHDFVFSQGESTFARRITPCFDEPRFKTPWQVTLVIPKAELGFSNMPLDRELQRDDGRHELLFVETPPIASYLVAVAVGPFEIVDLGKVGKQQVPLRAIGLPGQTKQLAALRRIGDLVDKLEAYFDDALPWPKLDLVVVPHLFGAMENPGLVTFDQAVIVGEPNDVRYVSHFVHVVAHELAHQWFGNLVTPAWWDDLWLSEAFASWLGEAVTGRVATQENDTELDAAVAREHAVEADREPDARPIRHAVVRVDDADDGFDAIAYDKGRTVLDMFERWIGEDGFRLAIRTYITDHRFGTVTGRDLFAAIAAHATPAVARVFGDYVTRAGIPIVELSLRCTAAPIVVAHARGGVTVPVCVRYPGVRGPARACALVADHAELALPQTDKCPPWLVGNDGAAYYEVVAGSPFNAKMNMLDRRERIAFGDDAASALLRGELSLAAALGQVRDLAALHDPYDSYAALAIVRVIDPAVDDATRDAWSTWIAAQFTDRVAAAALVTPSGRVSRELRAQLVQLVALSKLAPATSTYAATELTARLAQRFDPDAVEALVAITGANDGAAVFDRVRAEVDAATDHRKREALVTSLGELPASQVDRAVDLVTVGALAPELAWQAVARYFERPATRVAAWKASKPRLAAIFARFAPVTAGMVIDALGNLCDPTSRADVLATLTPSLSRIVDGKHHLDAAVASIDRCLARRTRIGDVAAALQQVP